MCGRINVYARRSLVATVSDTMSSNALTFDNEKPSKDDDEVYDSDAEPFEASWTNIDWRLSPGESHSDWTIQVVAIGEDHTGTTEYHVHQYFLTAGTRKSGYFEALCRADADFAEKKKRQVGWNCMS
ncbi:hypothetical protein MPSEU_000561700 [Mayamaea pseudoterrestris]|nr:hypothetical protein MPSEU_000561700 [Mayamaea pseudoterrestris]